MKNLERSISPREHRIGLLLALGAAFGFSLKAIFVKLAFAASDIDPASLLSLRMAFSLPFFLYLARRPAAQDQATPLGLSTIAQLALLACIGYFASSLLDFWGLQYVSTGLERLILFSYPSFVVILESIFARRLPTQKTVAALALTYLGIAVVMREDLQRTATLATDSRDLWFGSALIFCASITYAIYLARSRPLISELGSRRFTGIVLSGACVCSLAFQFATQPLEGLVQGPRVYAISLALAIISTVLPSWMLAKAIAVVGSSKTALIGCIGPVFTLLLATAFLGEAMGPAHLVGAALVLFGVWMISGAAGQSPATRKSAH